MKVRGVIVALSVAASIGLVSPAFAAGQSTFADCRALNAVMVNGVAKSAKAAASPSPFWIKVKPALVNTAVYTANKRLDRDGDGIACEVAR
jgi:hypothetical protein